MPAKVTRIPRKIGFREPRNSPLVMRSVLASGSTPVRQESPTWICAMAIHARARIGRRN
jgi:hypothetical protein